MSALSAYLQQAAGGRGGRELARAAERAGIRLSQATANRYLAGQHGRPSEDVLAAFHQLLGVPLGELRAAAGLPVGAEEPWTPPAEAHRLSPRQRRALDELIRAMAQPAAEPAGPAAPPAEPAAPAAAAPSTAPARRWPRPAPGPDPAELAAMVDAMDDAREPGPPLSEEELRGMAARRGRVVESEDEW